ncbi:unnamed protein product [Rotaria magnacalcarata]|uniref:Centrosomal protein POC5 n=1 Tax=Rotaria magnacalcarata TaxID=392030 RepID=A0A819IMX0_9BILA|nr:unnamed protein product [Rotaria magnacalcarata]CAF2158612.1 unnamed protein product [Rotaria magnacalcarata]CAF3842101.1 unnamed protein product [Rotaria magnacalcarata]CAF3918847.1 unnamed protein product [Rotaria magnacalcarata]
MSVSSDPPELPPDSPGSSVSSRLQNEYDDLLRRAVVVVENGVKTNVTMNQSLFGPGRRATNKKNVPATDLIDLSSPNTHRTDMTQSEIETQRQQLSNIPSLNQLLSTAAFSINEQQKTDKQLMLSECDDPLVHQLFRYTESVSNELESKPITEKMDHWYLDLKKNLMTEFDKLRLQFLEEAQQGALREKQAQAKEYVRLNQDIKTMREMLIHYENKIDQKDQSEKNLNKALDLLYNKTVAYRRYYEWRIIHIERRRQQYALMLAKRFYEDKMKRKALVNWKNTVDQEWKKRFENACEKKAKDVLIQLGNEYELKYKQLELELLTANEEIARLKIEKGDQDEALKKAFMRGVCALNMEAMSVLLKNENELETTTTTSINDERPRRCCIHMLDRANNDEQFIDEGTRLTDDVENDFKPSHCCPSLSTYVFKEHLPSTIYRTGEARSIRPTGTTNNQHRHVTFNKRPSTGTNRTRYPNNNNNVLVERHAPTNNIRS